MCIVVDADGGALCSGLCEATAQCPAGQLCDLLGPTGVCLPASIFAGLTLGSGAVGATCSSFSSCDSIAPATCGPFSGGGNVCTDTCAGAAVGCPSNWQCLTEQLFDPDAGASCAQDAGLCVAQDRNSDCWPISSGGDDRCHENFRADQCIQGLSLAAGTSGSVCTSDSQCKFNWCVGGQCADPCCTSNDCPQSQACAPILGPGNAQLLACYPSGGGTLALGQPCQLSLQQQCRSGYCVASNPYLTASQPGADTGYCSDTCCSDAQCGAGFACDFVGTSNADGGTAGLVTVCLKL